MVPVKILTCSTNFQLNVNSTIWVNCNHQLDREISINRQVFKKLPQAAKIIKIQAQEVVKITSSLVSTFGSHSLCRQNNWLLTDPMLLVQVLVYNNQWSQIVGLVELLHKIKQITKPFQWFLKKFNKTKGSWHKLWTSLRAWSSKLMKKTKIKQMEMVQALVPAYWKLQPHQHTTMKFLSKSVLLKVSQAVLKTILRKQFKTTKVVRIRCKACESEAEIKYYYQIWL